MDKDVFGSDKLLHMLACFGISLYSTEAAIGAAFAKEYGDMRAAGNHWCWWDLLADAVGIAVGTGLRLAITGKYTWY